MFCEKCSISKIGSFDSEKDKHINDKKSVACQNVTKSILIRKSLSENQQILLNRLICEIEIFWKEAAKMSNQKLFKTTSQISFSD